MTTDDAPGGRTATLPASAPERSRTRRHRWWYGAAALLALVWLFGVGPLGAFMGRLTEVQTNDQASFLPISAESTEVTEARKAFQGSATMPAIVVYSDSAPLGPERLGQIAQDAQRIAGEPYVAGQVAGPIPGTEDRSVAQLIVPLTNEGNVGDHVESLRELLAGTAAQGATVQVAGPAALSADLKAAFGGVDGTLLAVALGAVLIILILVYRSPLLPLVVILGAMLALVLAATVVYFVADAGWIELNGQSQGILFILVVGACTDYALLLVARYREALQEHERPIDAIRVAVRGTYEPILASGGTVILGVLCLLASDLASNRGLGPVAALGIAAALVAAFTFLPAVLLLLGRAAFWPLRPRPSADRAVAGSTEEVVRAHRLWGRIAAAVRARPRTWWVATAVVLAAAAAFVPQFRAEGTSQYDVFRTEVEAVAGQRMLERGFGAASAANPAIIIANADKAAEVTRAAQGVPGVTQVTPYAEGEGAEPKVVDGRVMLNAVLAEPAESKAAVEIVRDLRAAVHAVPGADAKVGGITAVNLDTLDTASRDLRVVIPLVLGVVLIVLIVLLRALVAPLLLIATTVLSFASALGVGALVFDHLLDLPGADPGVPLYAFVFLVALGIDYNIFIMTRAREETIRHGHRDGVIRALTLTGGVITSAGIVLAATFAALVVLPLLFLLQLAFLVAFGVLLDALVVRSLLVPALSLDVGRTMWWPSRLARKS